MKDMTSPFSTTTPDKQPPRRQPLMDPLATAVEKHLAFSREMMEKVREKIFVHIKIRTYNSKYLCHTSPTALFMPYRISNFANESWIWRKNKFISNRKSSTQMQQCKGYASLAVSLKQICCYWTVFTSLFVLFAATTQWRSVQSAKNRLCKDRNKYFSLKLLVFIDLSLRVHVEICFKLWGGTVKKSRGNTAITTSVTIR